MHKIVQDNDIKYMHERINGQVTVLKNKNNQK